MAQLESQDAAARYMDAQQSYMEGANIINSLLPYLFQYSYQTPGGNTVQQQGLIPYVWDLVFNRSATPTPRNTRPQPTSNRPSLEQQGIG